MSDLWKSPTAPASALRVHERGAGETLACGTGACAAVARRTKARPTRRRRASERARRRVARKLAGPGEPIWLTGPAKSHLPVTSRCKNDDSRSSRATYAGCRRRIRRALFATQSGILRTPSGAPGAAATAPLTRRLTISLVERQIEVMRERHAALEANWLNSCALRATRCDRGALPPLRPQTAARAVAPGGTRWDRGQPARLILTRSIPCCCSLAAHPRIHAALPALIAPDDPNLKSFESLFASAKPRCGQVRDSQREFLFGSDANDIGSVALVPLGDKGALGLLALGSTERDRFHPGMSTEFLGRMADLIADAVARQ